MFREKLKIFRKNFAYILDIIKSCSHFSPEISIIDQWTFLLYLNESKCKKLFQSESSVIIQSKINLNKKEKINLNKKEKNKNEKKIKLKMKIKKN